MPQKVGKKEETRKKMTLAASHSFRKHGYSGVGVDGLAKAAEVTSGAFYSHFGSKKEAFRLALGVGLDEVIESVPQFQSKYGKEWVIIFADYYLGVAHRDDLSCGCAMASLTSEVIRADKGATLMFEEKMAVIADLFAEGLAGNSENEKLSRAWAMLSLLVGGLNFARGMGDVFADQIADAVKSSVINVAGEVLDINDK